MNDIHLHIGTNNCIVVDRVYDYKIKLYNNIPYPIDEFESTIGNNHFIAFSQDNQVYTSNFQEIFNLLKENKESISKEEFKSLYAE